MDAEILMWPRSIIGNGGQNNLENMDNKIALNLQLCQEYVFVIGSGRKGHTEAGHPQPWKIKANHWYIASKLEAGTLTEEIVLLQIYW